MEKELRSRHDGWKPTGPLLETLDKFQAPPGVQRTIARRAGNLAGTPSLPISSIERIIEDSMGTNRGLPHWQHVGEKLALEVNATYRKLRR